MTIYPLNNHLPLHQIVLFTNQDITIMFYSPLVVFSFSLPLFFCFYKSPFRHSVLQSPKTNWASIIASPVAFLYSPSQNRWPHSGKTLLSCCCFTSRTVPQQVPHPLLLPLGQLTAHTHHTFTFNLSPY